LSLKLGFISFSTVINFSLSAPKFEETPIVAIEQGGTSETAIDGINETIDSMIKTSYFLVADRFPNEEILERQWHIDKKSRHWRGRNLRY
jgi:hypothetical protein